jgi:hypothetical protein
MQTKTIEKNIKAKLEEWLKTITDETLRKDVKENLLVSGGSVTSMFLNEPVNDYDIYLMDIDVVKNLAIYYTKNNEAIKVLDGRDKESIVAKLEKDYEFSGKEGLAIDMNNSYAISLRNLKDNQIKLYFEGRAGLKVNETIEPDKLNYTPLYFSPNAISLSHNLQIVLRFWGTAEQIHKTFDYIHATNYFTFKEGFVRNLEAVESILTKQLKYQGSYYPVTSIIRAKKFIKRGFNITAGELLKIMFQISQLDLSNADILEEQLIGVDVAYFDLIITALRNKFESDKDFKLSAEYFNSLIDKIFNEREDVEG